MLRSFLDRLYRGSGALAAFFLCAIAIVVLLQVGANVANDIVKLFTGTRGGLLVPSYADFGGFFLAATSFLALAYTLRVGGHIRVSLLLQHMGPRSRRVAEFWSVSAGAFIAGFFTWYTIGLALESLEFDDRSTGIVSMPLWVPQAVMAVGLLILTIALVDVFVGLCRGRRPIYVADEDASLTEQTLEGE